MKMLQTAIAVAGLATLTASVLPAQDLNLRKVSPDCTLTITSPIYSVCGGAFSGNDAGNPADQLSVLNWLAAPATASPSTGGGMTDPSFKEKVDQGNTGSFFKTVPDGQNGTIEFFSPLGGTFALSLKAGSNFSIFIFNLAAPVSQISYSTLGVGGAGQGNTSPAGLSHASLWFGGGAEPGCVGDACAEVPEPTSMALYGIGLVGLGIMASRRRRKV